MTEQEYYEQTRRVAFWRVKEHAADCDNPRQFFLSAEMSNRQTNHGEVTRDLIPDISPRASYYGMSEREFMEAVKKSHQPY